MDLCVIPCPEERAKNHIAKSFVFLICLVVISWGSLKGAAATLLAYGEDRRLFGGLIWFYNIHSTQYHKEKCWSKASPSKKKKKLNLLQHIHANKSQTPTTDLGTLTEKKAGNNLWQKWCCAESLISKIRNQENYIKIHNLETWWNY